MLPRNLQKGNEKSEREETRECGVRNKKARKKTGERKIVLRSGRYKKRERLVG